MTPQVAKQLYDYLQADIDSHYDSVSKLNQDKVYFSKRSENPDFTEIDKRIAYHEAQMDILQSWQVALMPLF